MIAAVGRATLGLASEVGASFQLFRKAMATYVDDVRRWVRRDHRRGRAYSGQLLLDQLFQIGVQSRPITMLTAVSAGMVFALEIGGVMVQKLGTSVNLGRVVSVSIVTELGPVLTALMVASRCGSAIAAELGSMKVTEQVDALAVLGAPPSRQLVAPRVLAAMLVLPILTFFADVIGVAGGWIVATTQIGVSSENYWNDVARTLLNDFLFGLFKTSVFGAILAVVSCRRGLETSGGAEGVGKSCIQAVVHSCMGILVMDYLLTAIKE